MNLGARRAFAVLALALALPSCTKATNRGAAGGGVNAWTQPGVLRFSEAADPKSLNPLLDGAAPTVDLSMFIFSWAVRYDANAHPFPDALVEVPTVTNGDVSRDGLMLKYKLRPNIRWQDGVTLTCDDLKFTWQVVMNPHNNVASTVGYRDIGSIDCSNQRVAIVHMKRLYAPFLQQLWGVNGNAPILPEHVLAKYNDDKGSFNSAPFNALPLGSGPFKVVAWNRGQDVRMVANPLFYLGAPKLKEVIYKILPDQHTALTQLQTHELDMLALGSGLQWPEYVALAANPGNGLKADRVDAFAWSHVDFNLRHPIMSDVRVRRALAYATDRNVIIEKVAHGSAIPAETDQQPHYSWAYTDDIVHYAYDPAKAKALLDADGWKIGPDGIRLKNGRRLEFTMSTASESDALKAVQTVLQQQWGAVGVQADIKNYPSSLFSDNSANGIVPGGHYDVALFGWFGAADPDDSALYSGANLAPHGQNSMFWTNAKATAAMTDALATIDQARRKRDYVVVQQQLALDVPTIILYFYRIPYVYNSDLKGFNPSPVATAFWDPWNYSI